MAAKLDPHSRIEVLCSLECVEKTTNEIHTEGIKSPGFATAFILLCGLYGCWSNLTFTQRARPMWAC